MTELTHRVTDDSDNELTHRVTGVTLSDSVTPSDSGLFTNESGVFTNESGVFKNESGAFTNESRVFTFAVYSFLLYN